MITGIAAPANNRLQPTVMDSHVGWRAFSPLASL
jgi:hypothetical protein